MRLIYTSPVGLTFWIPKIASIISGRGKTIDLEPIRQHVDEAHAKGIRVFGELFRKWNPRVLYLDHP